MISKTSFNELLDIPQANLTAKCPGNSSCALIIRVLGSLTQASTFTLTYLPNRNKLQPNSAVNDQIDNYDQFDYFWFTVNTRKTANWTYLIVAGSSLVGRDVDLYVTVGSGQNPTKANYDYKSELNGQDFVNISSMDP